MDGKEPGRFEEAALVITSWLQGTSRAGDPQEHIHNQIARLAWTLMDGKMRAKDTAALRAALSGMAAVASVWSEAALAREFGVEYRSRADGRGMRIAGTPQWLEEMFSSRTVSIDDRMPEAIAEWSRRHDGAQPNQAQVFALRQQVTLLSRESKTDGAIDWDQHAQEWDARSNGTLAQFPAQVSNMRGPDAGAARNGRNPGGPPERTAVAQAAHDALETVQRSKAAWTRAELLKTIAVTMPPETRQMAPDAAVRMLARIADDIIGSAHGDVVCLEAPEFLTWPESMRRGPDRRTVYERPGAARYATSAHLDAEHSLVSNAQRVGGWRMDAERAAELLGSSVPELEAALVTRSAEAGAGAHEYRSAHGPGRRALPRADERAHGDGADRACRVGQVALTGRSGQRSNRRGRGRGLGRGSQPAGGQRARRRRAHGRCRDQGVQLAPVPRADARPGGRHGHAEGRPRGLADHDR